MSAQAQADTVVALAVVGSRIESDRLSADSLGLHRAEDFDGDIAELVPDLTAHARLAAGGIDSRSWVLADIAVLLHQIYGPDEWLANVPTDESGKRLLEDGSWSNARTTGARWSSRQDRGHWHAKGLDYSHLSVLNRIQARDPDEAARWLDEAVENNWSTRALQRAVKGDRTPAPPADPTDVSLYDDLLAILRERHEASNIVLLGDTWYGLTIGAMVEAVERHQRLERAVLSAR